MRGEAACASVNRVRILGVVKNYSFQSDQEVLRPNVKEGGAFVHCSPQLKTKAKQNPKNLPQRRQITARKSGGGWAGFTFEPLHSVHPAHLHEGHRQRHKEGAAQTQDDMGIWEGLRGAAGVRVYCPHRCDKTESQSFRGVKS